MIKKNKEYFSKIEQCENDNVSIYKNIYQKNLLYLFCSSYFIESVALAQAI